MEEVTMIMGAGAPLDLIEWTAMNLGTFGMW